MNDGVYRDARVMTGVGSGVTLLGGFVLAVGVGSDDAGLGLLIIAIGQFLVWRGLITWSVAQGTEPVRRELAGLRAALLGSHLVDAPLQAAAPPRAAAPGEPWCTSAAGNETAETSTFHSAGRTTPAASTAIVASGWDYEADRHRCDTLGCTANGLPTSAYRCPACKALTART